MNNLVQKFFLYMFPFWPLWCWAFHFVTDKPLTMFVNLLLVPVAVTLLGTSKRRYPPYLVFFTLFAVFHIASAFLNKTIPEGTNKLFFVLMDYNVFACLLLIVVENTRFEEKFITTMNRNIFFIVILSLIVSVIQVKDPTFFYNDFIVTDHEEFGGEEEERMASIYSWYGPASGGITFPILISILLNFYQSKKNYFYIIILAGIVVSFLTKARYVMLSTIIVYSQLFFTRIKSFQKIVSLLAGFAVGIFLLFFIAKEVGFDIQEIISTRILEKDSEMESAKARVKSYEVFMIKFPEHPWFGVGPATRRDVIDLLGGGIPVIHVGYLSYLYYYGIFGFAPMVIALFILMRNAWSVGRKYKFWGSFFGLLSFAIANATFVYFNFAEMGIVLSVIYMRYYTLTYAEELQKTEHRLVAT